MQKSDIIAIVVSYNGLQKILRTIDALLSQVAHVHVVDNGSQSQSRIFLESLHDCSNVSINWLNVNMGIGAALNLGVDEARRRGFRWILTMDQDSTVELGMTDAYCQVSRIQPDVLCFCPAIEGIFGNSESGNIEVPYAITSGNLLGMDLIDQVGPYNEDLFIDGVDFDFSLRVRDAGYNIIRVAGAIMKHELGEAAPGRSLLRRFHTVHSPLRRYYMFRNYLYIFKLYFRRFPKFALKLMLVGLLYFLAILIYGPQRWKSFCYIYYGFNDYFCGRFGACRMSLID